MAKLFVVTTPKLILTGMFSFIFLFESKAPPEKILRDVDYGFVIFEDKEDDFINPFKLVRGEPNAIGPDGKKIWQIFLGKSGRQTFAGTVDEEIDRENGLQSLISEMPSANMLIQRDIYDRFEQAAKVVNYEIDVYHCDHSLPTS